jgi:hypothetical protein
MKLPVRPIIVNSRQLVPHRLHSAHSVDQSEEGAVIWEKLTPTNEVAGLVVFLMYAVDQPQCENRGNKKP